MTKNVKQADRKEHAVALAAYYKRERDEARHERDVLKKALVKIRDGLGSAEQVAKEALAVLGEE